ncbi:hypothetical protein [Helicobacter pullorum]|nr:hypothetical protein [Helicobacter pullorum]
MESSLGLDSNFIESLEVLETLESFNFGELDSNFAKSLGLDSNCILES